MLKALGLCFILVGSAGAGYGAAAQLSRRCEQLKEMKRVVVLLIGEITYANTPLPEALQQVSRRVKYPFSEFLEMLAQDLGQTSGKTLGALFQKNSEQYLVPSALKKEDLELLGRMGNMLGYLDRQMQLRNLELFQMELQQEINTLQENLPQKKKLYQTLGIMGGLFLAIFLI